MTEKMSNFKPRTPDYNVSCSRKDNQNITGQVGAAWRDEKGIIRIQLNPFVTIPAGQCSLTLFPADYKPKQNTGKQENDKPTRDESYDVGSEPSEVPF